MKKSILLAQVLAAAVFSQSITSDAQQLSALASAGKKSGSLDSRFGQGGSLTSNFLEPVTCSAATVLQQPDGKLVVGGGAQGYFVSSNAQGFAEFALTRIGPDGSTDVSFGKDGKVTTDFFTLPFGYGEGSDIRDMILQPDGRIIAVGPVYQGADEGQFSYVDGFALARYLSNGHLDNSFGVDGRVLSLAYQLPTSDPSAAIYGATARALALQADGKVIVAGGVIGGVTYFKSGYIYGVARYNSDGSLDPAFGNGGLAIFDPSPQSFLDEIALDVVIQPDRRILVLGSGYHEGWNVFRLNTDGTLDLNYGSNGVAAGGSQFHLVGASKVVLGSDAKLVVVGRSDFRELGLLRFDANGQLDTSFGSNGVVQTEFDADIEVAGIGIQSDGKIVVSGTRIDSFAACLGNYDSIVIRYKSNGQLDNGFGSNGVVVTDSPTGAYNTGRGLVIQGNHRIVVVGSAQNADGPCDIPDAFLAARYNQSNGSLDRTFGGTGVVLTSFLGWRALNANALALQRDGKTVLAGSELNRGGIIARYDADGSLDHSFGMGGAALLDPSVVPGFDPAYGEDDMSIQAIALQPDGKIVAGGNVAASCCSQDDFLLVRCNQDGSLDSSFGSNGVVRTQLTRNERNDSFDVIKRVFIQPNGTILVVGNSDVCSNPFGLCTAGGNYTDSDIVLARYSANGILDTMFGPGQTGLEYITFGTNSDDTVDDAVMRPDGKVAVLANTFDRVSSTNRLLLLLYDNQGQLQTGFGSGGSVIVDQSDTSLLHPAFISVQPDNKLLVGTSLDRAATGEDFVLRRYNSNGKLDSTFGVKGKVVTDLANGSADEVSAIAVGPDGNIIAAGSSQAYFPRKQYTLLEAVAVRYDASGRLDKSFGESGVATIKGFEVPDSSDDFFPSINLSGVVFRGDGRIIMSGGFFNPFNLTKGSDFNQVSGSFFAAQLLP